MVSNLQDLPCHEENQEKNLAWDWFWAVAWALFDSNELKQQSGALSRPRLQAQRRSPDTTEALSEERSGSAFASWRFEAEAFTEIEAGSKSGA